MKNLNAASVEASNPLRAISAIQTIRQLVQENYPQMPAEAQSRIIVEMLLEITEEEKLLRA